MEAIKTQFLEEIETMFGFNLTNNEKNVEFDFGQYKLNRLYKPLVKTYAKQFFDSLGSDIENDKEKQKVIDTFIDFFSLYYNNGDFGYFKSKFNNYQYRVNYSGNDTEYFWSTKDCYYIKTTDVINEIGLNAINNQTGLDILEKKEDIKLVFYKRTKHPDNGKGKYEFTIDFKDLINENGDKIGYEIIFYNWEESKITKSSKLKQIKEELKEKGIDYVKNTGLQNALDNFLKKWGRDYFIHKRLKEFLSEELEWYFFQVLKSDIQNKVEILELQNKINSLKEKHSDDKEYFNFQVAKLLKENNSDDKNLNIYTFSYAWIFNFINILSDLEELKKSIWLKKRKVIREDFCITLGRLDEIIKIDKQDIFNEIATNKKQLEEWKELLSKDLKHIKDISLDIILNEVKSLSLEKAKNIVVDSKHFDRGSEVYKRLVGMGKMELYEDNTNLNGMFIKSENFQGLNSILDKYIGKIQCIYIDPPYNATSSEIMYKNEYKHGTWASFMENRITIGKKLLTDDGVMIIAIDENEQESLGKIIDIIFSPDIYTKKCVSVRHNSSGQQGDYLSLNNEFAYFITKKGNKSNLKLLDEKDQYYVSLKKSGTEDTSRSSAKTCFYPILVKDSKIVGFGDISDDNYHPEKNVDKGNGIVEVYPVDDKGEKKWRYSRHTVEKIINLLEVYKDRNGNYDIKKAIKYVPFKTFWDDTKYLARDYGTFLLKDILGKKIFDFPKSIHTVIDSVYLSSNKNSLVLDFFSGSGTTQHAVMKLNKKDGGNRKFIGIEIGNHFDTVIVPRLKKLSYSSEWKNGHALNTKGYNNLFSYKYLNQYQNWFNEDGYLKDLEIDINSLEKLKVDENKISDLLVRLKDIKEKIIGADDNL